MQMFGFGIKALEQFVDRLVEWPQYCNHILQISHLRGTHPELVAFAERVLTRISSGAPEPDAGNISTVDQRHGSLTAAHFDVSFDFTFWLLYATAIVMHETRKLLMLDDQLI